ncbi:hypothetical protein [Pseudogemmobacter faecipullorum]|uniref:Uncharacterized protein n=1 Tax=Pseudogemmobacter faecipullorum TaxID=2755041 RepID=A0ABS8CRB7_9RHOB|nr:hypothetical protein [Pseudogemmobacter faecipullorum]MCB5411705.1 hypothetical protein [Pseudogemmobacter faecipullorum]
MKAVSLALGLLAFGSAASADGINLSAVENDLNKALASSGPIVWMIYGPVDRPKMDAAIELLKPVRDRLTVGVYGDFQGPLAERWQEDLTAAGFKVCTGWGEGVGLNNGPRTGTGNMVEEMQYAAMQVSDSDVLFFSANEKAAPALSAAWENEEVVSGAAGNNFVIAGLASEQRDPARVTDDAQVGAMAAFTYQQGGQGCFWK